MSEQVKKYVGVRVRERRKKCGLTQDTLAEKADLSINFVGSIERGEANASFQTLEAIAKTLDCELRYFFETEYNDKTDRQLSKLLEKQIKGLDKEEKKLLLQIVDSIRNK